MKYKSIIILVLTIFVLITIAGVSAAEANDTAIASEDTGEIGLSAKGIETDDLKTGPEDTPLTQTVNKEIISEPDDGSFKALQDKISNANSGETITLENNYTREDDFINEDDENTGIVISKSLIIDGQGHTIDAQQKGLIFEVKTTHEIINVIIKNIYFVNGNGGSVHFDGFSSGSVINCSL